MHDKNNLIYSYILITTLFFTHTTHTNLFKPLRQDDHVLMCRLEKGLTFATKNGPLQDIPYFRARIISYIWKTTYIHHNDLPYKIQQPINKYFKQYLSILDNSGLCFLGLKTQEIRSNITEHIKHNSFDKKPTNMPLEEFYRKQLYKYFSNPKQNPYIIACKQILERKENPLQQKTRH